MDTVPWSRHTLRVAGERLTLEARSTSEAAVRYCTGRYDLRAGRGEPCPDRAALALENAPPSRSQCDRCFAATGFNPAFYFAQQISPQQRERNRSAHCVYLAWFGPSTLKVGMTHAPRKLSRLLEQGARLGAILGTFETADRARELEATIARDFDVSETVRSSRKRQLLCGQHALPAARHQLSSMVADIAALLPGVNPRAEVLELDRYYGARDLLAAAPADLCSTQPLAISGRCLGMIGDILITQHSGQRYMLSIGALLGQSIRVHSSERVNRLMGQLGFSF
jgi:hypothetical protein